MSVTGAELETRYSGALQEVTEVAKQFKPEELPKLNKTHIDALAAFVTEGLVERDTEVEDGVDLFGRYGASPATVRAVLERYPQLGIGGVSRLYEMRGNVEGANISGLAGLVEKLGMDVVGDDGFQDALAEMTDRIYDGMKAARSAKKGYVDASDSESRMRGIAFNVALGRVKQLYRDGFEITDWDPANSGPSDADYDVDYGINTDDDPADQTVETRRP